MQDYTVAITTLINLLETNNNEAYIYLFLADIYQYKLKNIPDAKIYLQKYLEISYDSTVEKRLLEL